MAKYMNGPLASRISGAAAQGDSSKASSVSSGHRLTRMAANSAILLVAGVGYSRSMYFP